jgi:hypothetical protein
MKKPRSRKSRETVSLNPCHVMRVAAKVDYFLIRNKK